MRHDLGIEPTRSRPDGPAGRLTADCARCVGLCCVALPFTASSDFAFDKAAGQPCVNLGADYGCQVHSRLRDIGLPGCTVFDCFGAGQQVTQVTFGGQSWRELPGGAAAMFEAFGVVRQLHELLWYLQDASTRPAARELDRQVGALHASTERLTALPAGELCKVDVQEQRAAVDEALERVSTLVRAEAGGQRRSH